MGINNTYLTQNNIWYPLLSIFETKRTLLLCFGNHNTFDALITSLVSNQNDIVLDPCISCFNPIPNSTHKPEPVSTKVSNNSLTPLMCWCLSLDKNHEILQGKHPSSPIHYHPMKFYPSPSSRSPKIIYVYT
jgi:hypothetical protein